MFVTTPHDHVIALDPVTGKVKWIYNPDLPPLSHLAACCGQVNRGVAVGDGKVFVGQLDGSLVALYANNGNIAWATPVEPWEKKWTETMAPLYVDGKVIIGASGGEYLRRGHISAYDASSGELLWRFYTIPGPGEKGHDTWEGDSWQTGGGTVWSTPVGDTKLGLLYLTTGNAGPDMNGSRRKGSNLFTSSVVAIDLATGEYRWHYQEVHHDLWDYDAVQPPVLFMLSREGKEIPAIGHANKNGYYYILDRRDGKPVYDIDETRVPAGPAWQNAWPTQPIPAIEELIPHTVEFVPSGLTAAAFYTPPQEKPLLIQPGFEGGPTWCPPAFSPRTKFAYIPANGYGPWVYRATEKLFDTEGSTAEGKIQGVTDYGILDAVDTTTGKIAWRIRTPQRLVTGITIAGNVGFYGESNGKFNAFDAKSGKILWTYHPTEPGATGANGAPAVFTINGREYVTMAFGGNNEAREEGSSDPGDALITFALPAGAQAKPTVISADVRQVDTGTIPDSSLQATTTTAPPDATVIDINIHDYRFFPSNITVRPGEKIALRVANVDPNPVTNYSFALNLPEGPIGLKDSFNPGQFSYLVFYAPTDLGKYAYYSPDGGQKFYGLMGWMHVEEPK